MKPHVKKEKDWLLPYIFSVLVYDFSHDARDFWWGSNALWDKNKAVKFRFFKIFLAEFIALTLKFFLLFMFGVIMLIYRGDHFYGGFYFGFSFVFLMSLWETSTTYKKVMKE